MTVTQSVHAKRRKLGSACVSHVGCGVAPQHSSRDFQAGGWGLASGEVRGREDAIAPAGAGRDACATRSSAALAILHSALILFVSISAWSVSAAPAGKEQDRASAVVPIRSVLRAQQDAWNRGDIDGFMNGYARSKSTIFISEDALRRGWETVRDRYRKKYSDRAKMGTLAFSDLEITPLSSDSAMVLGRWRLERANDRPHGRFTLIFRKIPPSRDWRIVLDHTSAAPSPK